jgi:hypothetical protein
MARSRFNEPIEPMTLGNMRANGVRSLEAPDAETAIKKAIDEFKIEPAFHKRLLAQRRA